MNTHTRHVKFAVALAILVVESIPALCHGQTPPLSAPNYIPPSPPTMPQGGYRNGGGYANRGGYEQQVYCVQAPCPTSGNSPDGYGRTRTDDAARSPRDYYPPQPNDYRNQRTSAEPSGNPYQPPQRYPHGTYDTTSDPSSSDMPMPRSGRNGPATGDMSTDDGSMTTDGGVSSHKNNRAVVLSHLAQMLLEYTNNK